jgi:pimeloyl-ACP methyl ester carboxylesterase
MRRRALLRSTAAVLWVAVIFSGCSPAGSSPEPTSSPAAATASATPSPSPTSVIPPDGRPTEPIPDVVLYGYVDPPPGEGMSRYSIQSLEWQPCGQTFECADVRAPLDYADPNGQAITLSLARRKATVQPRLGSLFLNPGGPGASGRDLLAGFDAKGLERYDLIGWDPRGTDDSTPVQCFPRGADFDRYLATDGSPDDDAELGAEISENRAFAEACLKYSGSLLQHVSTLETVRDLDLLRGLVKDEKINYLGFSYGTLIGSLYAQTYPKRVGRVVLDGAVDIVESPVTQLEGFQRALSNFATWCATKKCALGNNRDKVLTAVSDLLTRLDTQPIKVGRRQLTQSLALTGVIYPLYGQENAWDALRQALNAATKGDGSKLLRLADAYAGRHDDGSYDQDTSANAAIRCRDSQKTSVAKELKEDAAEIKKNPSTLSPFWGSDLLCPVWPVAPAPKLPKITARGARPIVVVGTTGDPATPYEYAAGMSRQLDSGVLITLRGYGHTAYSQSACIRTIVQAYLIKDVVPRKNASCSNLP